MKFINILCFVVFLSFSCLGQIDVSSRPTNAMCTERTLLNQDKPSVYLEYVKSGVGQKILESDSKNRVWLRLINNSVWQIGIIIFPGDSNGERGVFHSVEKIRTDSSRSTIPTGYRIGDTGFYRYQIESGGSLMFSVPANHLEKNLLIRTNFTYSWELKCAKKACPEHSVVFTNNELVEQP